MARGRDASEFFSDVVKNIAVRATEVKKMVCAYLAHYADANAECSELALLAVNSFQKDLSSSNQLIRALSLRVLTTIRVPEMIPIQLLAARRGSTDSSSYVRQCAARCVVCRRVRVRYPPTSHPSPRCQRHPDRPAARPRARGGAVRDH